PPMITAVTVVAGPLAGVKGIPLVGGSTIQVDGEFFHYTDTVTLGTAARTATVAGFLTHTPTRFTFAAPPGTLGDAALTVTDGAGQTASFANAVRYVGYTDATAARSPGASAVDSLIADRGAVGDLDRDGHADDVVLVSSYYTYLG